MAILLSCAAASMAASVSISAPALGFNAWALRESKVYATDVSSNPLPYIFVPQSRTNDRRLSFLCQ